MKTQSAGVLMRQLQMNISIALNSAATQVDVGNHDRAAKSLDDAVKLIGQMRGLVARQKKSDEREKR